MRQSSKFEPAVRRNWGYWDGRADSKRGRMPLWSKTAVYRCKHPVDRVYGEAYWQGYYGEPHPNTGLVPGTPEFAYFGD